MWVSLIYLWAAACVPQAVELPETPTQPSIGQKTLTLTPTPSPTVNLAPTSTYTPISKPTSTATAAQAFALCSPLEGIDLSGLSQPDLLKNPFQPPRPGMDDGHQGVDFAYWSRGERKAMLGHPVQAVLSGQVAGVIQNRQPYGYAVIIETPLENLPAGWLASVQLPEPAPTVPPAASLVCPPDPTDYSTPSRSLYLLYAHLNQAPLVSPGQKVTCGQSLGEVGTTGRSVNPHLHLEARVGPAGAVLSEMTHYDNSASETEMRNYCTWRVSGLFQMLDPMSLLQPALQP